MDYQEEFLDFCKYQRGLAENTIRSYEWEVSEYLQWLKGRKLKVNTVKVRDVDAYLISLRKRRENKTQTVNHKMYCLKTFHRWLQRIEVTKRNPLEVFQNSKTPKPLPRYLTQAEQEALLLASQNGNHREDWIRKRDCLMTLFFLDTGLRVGEACQIEIKNLDLDNGILRVTGKGSKEREVILSDRLITATRSYLGAVDNIVLNKTVGPGLPARGFSLVSVVKEMGISHSTVNRMIYSDHPNSHRLRDYINEKIKPLPLKYLFFNQGGKHMNTRHVFRIIQEIGERAGIKDLHPHVLRHTYASNLRVKGGDLLLIKEALGHSSVQTTEIYAHIGDGEYRERLKRLVN
jgi:site-specific recombinase XerD